MTYELQEGDTAVCKNCHEELIYYMFGSGTPGELLMWVHDDGVGDVYCTNKAKPCPNTIKSDGKVVG